MIKPSTVSPCHCINLREASRRMTRLYDHALTETGLKITQYSLLSKIKRLGSPSLQALAIDANLDRSTLGRNARILQKAGFVKITEDRKDKRLSRLHLTGRGEATLKEARDAWTDCQKRIEAAMGGELYNQLYEMIVALSRLEPEAQTGKDN